RRRGKIRADWTDWATYLYLFLGVAIMFAPVLWVVMSSFKTPDNLSEFPPTFLPYATETVTLEGYDEPLPLFEVKTEDGGTRLLAQIRREGLREQSIDPANQEACWIVVSTADAKPVRRVLLTCANYAQLLSTSGFDLWLLVYNSL